MEEPAPESATLTLLAAGGSAGIHLFTINLEEPTLHESFIKRRETLDPINPGDSITGAIFKEQNVHFIVQNQTLSTLHEAPLSFLISQARLVHKNKLDQALDSEFYWTQRTHSLFNGLLASVPFDADRLVDAFGFDTDESLEAQLKAHNILDSLTEEEKNDLQTQFSHWKQGGEVAGFVGQIAALGGRVVQVRKLRKARVAQNIEEINQLRMGLGLAPSTEILQSKAWLSKLKSEELFVQDASQFTAQLHRLEASAIFNPTEMAKIVAEAQIRSTHIRPLEQVLSSLGHASQSIQKLERWSFGKIIKFFKSVTPKDIEALFTPDILSKWERWKKLEAMEELSEFQKVEHYYLFMDVKAALLRACQEKKSLDISTKTFQTLEAMEARLALAHPGEIHPLVQEATALAQKLDQSEQAYRLDRILKLNQAGRALSDLEKLEKLKLLVKSGWTGNIGKSAEPTWSFAEFQGQRAKLLDTLDHIYDFEQMQRSTYLQRTFKRGKFKEALLYTAYSDTANIAIEAWAREREGRPFLSPGLAHNLIWNTYIMIPIFATSGLRLGRGDKIFIIIVNATSSSFITQKMTKWGGDLLNIEDGNILTPSPKMPVSEMPAYLLRDTFINHDPTFDSGWFLFDSAWCMFLSTPRGIGVSHLSNYMVSRPALDQNGFLFGAVRQSVRAAPVFANETLGAATYTVIYPQFFDNLQFNLNLLDAKLEVIDPWQSAQWETVQPKLRLSLSIHSSTKPKPVRFHLSDGKNEQWLELPQELWKETHEQFYDLTWEKEITYGQEPTFYILDELQISNESRKVGSSLNPFQEKTLEEGKTLEIEDELVALAQAEDPFVQGLFKALLSISKEASTQLLKSKPHFAAGMVYMVGQYLDAVSLDLVKAQKSESTSLDILKEAVQLTKMVNFSDTPITKDLIDQLNQRLEALTYESIPNNTIFFSEPESQQKWLHLHTSKILSAIQEDILKETRSSWGVLDEGSKVDWYTLQLYRGYSFGLSKLYQWTGSYFRDSSQLYQVLDEMKNYGNELEQSWTASLYWSDDYLVEFANKFKLLEEVLKDSSSF
ncbi:MAG: hypothetical protein HYY62_03435 [Deltaproteobacteria bacterium]|nr:hypothetical protein [Deltaproteobacteria bacterium]